MTTSVRFLMSVISIYYGYVHIGDVTHEIWRRHNQRRRVIILISSRACCNKFFFVCFFRTHFYIHVSAVGVTV